MELRLNWYSDNSESGKGSLLGLYGLIVRLGQSAGPWRPDESSLNQVELAFGIIQTLREEQEK